MDDGQWYGMNTEHGESKSPVLTLWSHIPPRFKNSRKWKCEKPRQPHYFAVAPDLCI